MLSNNLNNGYDVTDLNQSIPVLDKESPEAEKLQDKHDLPPSLEPQVTQDEGSKEPLEDSEPSKKAVEHSVFVDATDLSVEYGVPIENVSPTNAEDTIENTDNVQSVMGNAMTATFNPFAEVIFIDAENETVAGQDVANLDDVQEVGVSSETPKENEVESANKSNDEQPPKKTVEKLGIEKTVDNFLKGKFDWFLRKR